MKAPWRSPALTGLAILLLLGFAAPVAGAADRPIPPGALTVEALDPDGDPVDLAGAHPDRLVVQVTSPEDMVESPNVIVIDFPPGMGGDPSAMPSCRRSVFEEDLAYSKCPPGSEVGALTGIEGGGSTTRLPIFNLAPAPGELVAFGIPQVVQMTKISGRLRPHDNGLSLRVEGLPQEAASGQPLATSRFEFWGIPADHHAEPGPRRPFLTLPVRCDRGPLEIGMRLVSWERPDSPVSGRANTGRPLRGCEGLAFAPSLDFALETPRADTPSGLGIDITFPDDRDPDGRGAAQTRNASIELPAGTALSPAAAAGLAVCRDADLHRGSSEPASCPPASRVGSVEIAAPQLAQPIAGRVYLGEQRDGERFRLFVVAAGDGVEAKFVGALRPDPISGRLTAQLTDLPEMSFARLSMRFEGGPDALLVAPLACGPATATATLTPHSGGPAVGASATTTVAGVGGGACGAAPFRPSLTVGASSLRAGRPTSISAVLSREDGEQLTERFALTFPPGLTASTGAVARCADAAAAVGACPEASRIGSAFVEAGSGAKLAGLNGSVYLTGPYRRAPFGVVLAFRAALGPFDFGSFVVRAALEVDATTGRVTVQTDPLPQSFEGVPIRLRGIGLEIDRPGFMRAPTSCETKRVEATVTAVGGATARPAGLLQPYGCVELPFRPGVSMALSGRGEMRRGGNPGLEIAMRTPPGNANMREIEMSLPAALRLEAASLREICARREALAGRCPKSSRVGEAKARTPLLGQPLKGQINIVQPRGKGQPDLWVSLAGEGMEVEIRSRASSEDGRIVTRFEDLPDMPLAAVKLSFASGERGILSLKRGICGKGVAGLLAPARFEGQNGALRALRVRASAPGACGDAGSPRRAD